MRAVDNSTALCYTCLMSKENEFYRFINRAYVRDGDKVYFSGAMLLATLLHTHGDSRESQDLTDVRRIMNDHNLKKD